MNKTKIDWCDRTWNPVTGCMNDCPYCYARKQARRFQGHCYGDIGIDETTYNDCPTLHIIRKPTMRITKNERWVKAPYPFGFEPTFHEYRLDEPERIKKPQTIFVCSMADLFGEWVPDTWIRDVFRACERAPQHRYLFLTKNPQRYIDLAQKDMLPRQHWYGYTATTEKDLWRFKHADECPCINLFVSIEPMQERISAGFCSHCPADWVIIGAETGNRKGKVIPQREWVESIAKECEYSGIPLLMKGSLLPIMGEQFVQEFPWEVRA